MSALVVPNAEETGTDTRDTQSPITDSGASEIRAGILVLLLFFGGFLGWLTYAPLDAAVIAPGTVVVSGNRQTLQHREGGVIAKLNVRDGQHVTKGDLLIELAAPEVVAQEQVLLSQILDLQVQRQRIRDELNGARTLTRPPEWASLPLDEKEQAEEAFLRSQNTAAENRPNTVYASRIAGYTQQIRSLDQQEVLLRDELAGMQKLADKQLVPLTRVRSLERALADLEGQRASLRAQIAVAKQDRVSELRLLDSKLETITPQLAAAKQQMDHMQLRAPASGAVVGLNYFTVGGVIGPGSHVLDIVPENSELVVLARVRPDDADDLRPGMATQVRITAFHGRDRPILDGVVRTVSADRLVDEKTGAPYFTTQIVVSSEELARFKAQHRLAPLSAGLPAEIVVPTRKRTALQYLLEPLDQAMWRSFREN